MLMNLKYLNNQFKTIKPYFLMRKITFSRLSLISFLA